MPYYELYCPECDYEKYVECTVDERNNYKCDKCGTPMKVAIRTTNILMRGIPLKTRKWMRERDL